MLGKTVFSYDRFINYGNNIIELYELRELSNSLYTVKVTINNKIFKTAKFLKL